MNCRSGRVTRLAGDSAIISVTPRNSCERCAEGRGCGLALFSGWFGRGEIQFTAAREPDWSVGQTVALEVPPGALVKAATVAYGGPLTGLIGGIAIGQWLGSDLHAAVGGVGGLVLALWLTRQLGTRIDVSVEGVE